MGRVFRSIFECVAYQILKNLMDEKALDYEARRVGLDVTPEEIAVSIVAEMIAMRRAPESDWRSLSKSVFSSESLRALLK